MAASDHPASSGERRTSLALYQDKSPTWPGCPTPRVGRAYLIEASGELLPIPCGRNTCASCRPRNVQVTAAMVGINATRQPHPPTYAVLATTRDYADEPTLRNGWKDLARRVRGEVGADAGYAWFREWTQGLSDGVRRTHYHSIWTHLDRDDQGAAVAEISNQVWALGRFSPSTTMASFAVTTSRRGSMGERHRFRREPRSSRSQSTRARRRTSSTPDRRRASGRQATADGRGQRHRGFHMTPN